MATALPTNFYNTQEWRQLRRQALIRDQYKCVSCGKDVSGYKQSRVDHVIPYRKRPDLGLSLSNLRTLCITCDANRHSEKGGGSNKEEIGQDGFPPSWS